MAKRDRTNNGGTEEYTPGTVDEVQAAEAAAAASFDEGIEDVGVIPEGWKKISVGFPPYWKGSLGRAFRGQVLMRDDRDPDFVRYHILNTAGKSLKCQKGPVDDEEIIMVDPGDIFTVGGFAGLPLDTFFGHEVVAQIVNERTLPGNELSKNRPRSFYDFEVTVSPETQKLLRQQREEDRITMLAAAKAGRAKALENMVNKKLTTGAPAPVTA